MNKALSCGCGFIVFALALTIMIIAIIANTNMKFNSRSLVDISDNWLSHPIVNIIDTKGDCAEQDLLAIGGWEGTDSGCDCRHAYGNRIQYTDRRIIPSVCNMNMTLSGCENIRPISPVQFRSWRGANLCASRSLKSFYDYAKNTPPRGRTCEDGYKQCGLIDTSGNLLCLKENEVCPVNKILVLPDNEEEPKDYTYQKIRLRQGVNLYFTNEATDEPVLVDARLSQGKICIDPTEYEKPRAYVLERRQESQCKDWLGNGIIYDPRYVQIDSYSRYNLFDENGILPLIHSLPEYPTELLKGNYNIYVRPYLAWNHQCLSDRFYNPDIIREINSNLTTAGTKQLIIMILAIFAFIFALIASLVTCNVEKDNEFCAFVFICIFCLFTVAISVLCYIAMTGIKEVVDFSGGLIEKRCGDEISSAIFGTISRNMQSWHNLVILILSAVCFLIYPLMLAVNSCLAPEDNQNGPLMKSEENHNNDDYA